MVERDESLAVPDSFETLIDEAETLYNEEGTEEVPEDEGKRNSAFARQRQINKKLTDALRGMAGTLKEQAAASNRSRSAAQRPQPSERATTIRTYREDVRSRALQRLGRQVDLNDPEDMADWSFEMNQIIVEDHAAFQQQQSATRNKASVVSDVLSRFSQLDDGDKAAIKKEIDALPVQAQADAEAVQDKVHSYLGRHIEKFSKVATKSEKKGATEETESDQDEDYGLTTIDDGDMVVRGHEEDLVDVGGKAGAARASGLKGGSKGIHIKPDKTDSTHQAVPKLSAEDRSQMERLDLDPRKPADVETLRDAQRRKTKYAG